MYPVFVVTFDVPSWTTMRTAAGSPPLPGPARKCRRSGGGGVGERCGSDVARWRRSTEGLAVGAAAAASAVAAAAGQLSADTPSAEGRTGANLPFADGEDHARQDGIRGPRRPTPRACSYVPGHQGRRRSTSPTSAARRRSAAGRVRRRREGVLHRGQLTFGTATSSAYGQRGGEGDGPATKDEPAWHGLDRHVPGQQGQRRPPPPSRCRCSRNGLRVVRSAARDAADGPAPHAASRVAPLCKAVRPWSTAITRLGRRWRRRRRLRRPPRPRAP